MTMRLWLEWNGHVAPSQIDPTKEGRKLRNTATVISVVLSHVFILVYFAKLERLGEGRSELRLTVNSI